jgi:hypothetical protein
MGVNMRKRHIFLIGFALATGISACSPDKKDKNESISPPNQADTPKGRALTLAEFTAKSFNDVPWESNCEGIGHFFLDFAANYLPGVEFISTPRSCYSFADANGNFIYNYDFAYKKGEKSISLRAEIEQQGDMTKGEIRRVTEKLISLYRFEADDTAVGENLMNLPETLQQWITSQGKQKIFLGRPYSQFVNEFAERFQSETGAVLKADPRMKIRITPSADRKTSGKLEFLELADTYFKSADGPFFGCQDLDCIRSKKFSYMISGPRFTITSEEVETSNGVAAGRYWYEDIKVWP